jgi:hypothetical protein
VTHNGIGVAFRLTGKGVGIAIRVGRGVTVRVSVGVAGGIGRGRLPTLQARVNSIVVTKDNKTLFGLIFQLSV